MNSLKSKLANKKVEGVFWPVVEILGGVWAFFPLMRLNILHLFKQKSYSNSKNPN